MGLETHSAMSFEDMEAVQTETTPLVEEVEKTTSVDEIEVDDETNETAGKE